jgi:PAS domain S-box-containing protein
MTMTVRKSSGGPPDPLTEPEEIVRALRQGEVDALVVSEPGGERIYSLRSADLLYRAMIEEMKDGAVALDAHGTVVYCNAYFAQLMKAERSAIVGGSVFSFVPDNSRPFFERLHDPKWVNGTGRSELILRTADGDLVPALATMNRIHVEDNEVFCLILTDLTEQKRREELLVESRRKDEFLAMLAHELRNPLAPIRHALQVLGMAAGSSTTSKWASDVIERQVQQLARLTDDLLDVSRITRGKIRLDLEPLDLNVVIGRAVETVRPLIDARQQELTISLPDHPVGVQADATRLSQVVSNLLNNASKFTPERGQIWLGVDRREPSVEITVRDSGCGIAPEMLGRVFDLFAQADSTQQRAQGGLGIGLTLVRTLVEMHGGSVEGSSEGPGLGSRFTVRLPLWPGESWRPTPQERPAPRPAAEGGSRRILVVDDNVDAAETMMMWLRLNGHDVRVCYDGESALREARAFRPHVMFVDIGLPGMNGNETARALRLLPELAGTVLVAATGYGQESDRRRSRAAGFDHHWVKPIDPNAVDELLASLAKPPAGD